jgi:peptidase M50B-like protein
MTTTRAQLLAARTDDEFLRLAARFRGGVEAAQEFMRSQPTIRGGGTIELVERTGAGDARLREELRVRERRLAEIAAEDRQRSATPARSGSKPLYQSAAPLMKTNSGPAWRLLPRPAPRLDPADPDVQTAARHEAGHAAAAHLLGWQVTSVRLNADGSGFCGFHPPTNLDRSLRHRQHAVICLAGRAHTGWTALDGDKQDRRNAHKALGQIGGGTHLSEAVEAETKRLAATPKFRTIAARVTEALLEHGRLDASQVEPLLLAARREYARAS